MTILAKTFIIMMINTHIILKARRSNVMKCKVLSGKHSKGIEKDLNDWLSANSNIQIKFITQGGAGSSIVTTIFYE